MMRDLLFKDYGWKLFSLLLAAFIWYTVHKLIEEPGVAGGGANTVTYGDLPVLIVATAADAHLYHINPDKVSVTVSGPADTMSKLEESQIRATVDLSDLGSAKDLDQPVEVSVPPGVELISIIPAKVIVIPPPKH
jgi:hypothetical protein